MISKEIEQTDEAIKFFSERNDMGFTDIEWEELKTKDHETSLCMNCSGSGEGQYEGTTCRVCKGKGEV